MTTFCTQAENGYNTSLSSFIKTCNIDFLKAETINSVKIESKQICCFQRQVLCLRLCPVTLFKGIHKVIKDMAENITRLKRKAYKLSE